MSHKGIAILTKQFLSNCLMFWPVKRNDPSCLQETDLREMQSLCQEELIWKALKLAEEGQLKVWGLVLVLNFSTVHRKVGFNEKSILQKCLWLETNFRSVTHPLQTKIIKYKLKFRCLSEIMYHLVEITFQK